MSIGNLHRQDDGCYLHPECLTCPRPICIFDEPKTYNDGKDELYETAKHLRLIGSSIDDIAKQLKISVRTVYRYINK